MYLIFTRNVPICIQMRSNGYCFIQPLLQFRETFIGYSCRNPDTMVCCTIEKLIEGNLHLLYTQARGMENQTGTGNIIAPNECFNVL